MATRATPQSQNRTAGSGRNGLASNSMDVGHSAITRMAREDTRWFIVAVVILSLVLFLALPMSLLILVETEKMKSEVRYEVKQLKKLKAELKKKDEPDELKSE